MNFMYHKVVGVLYIPTEFKRKWTESRDSSDVSPER